METKHEIIRQCEEDLKRMKLAEYHQDKLLERGIESTIDKEYILHYEENGKRVERRIYHNNSYSDEAKSILKSKKYGEVKECLRISYNDKDKEIFRSRVIIGKGLALYTGYDRDSDGKFEEEYYNELIFSLDDLVDESAR